MAWSEQGFGYQRPSAAPRGRPSRAACGWEGPEQQRIWLRVGGRAWRTLAVVPAEEGMSTYYVANLIMALGVSHGESIGVFDFRDIRVNRVLELIREAERQLERGDRVIFAAGSIRENLATIPLARATDGAVLCVSIGSTSMGLAAETIEQIGRDRFFGSILIRPPHEDAPHRPVTEVGRRLTAGC
jgi:hypothetical protein